MTDIDGYDAQDTAEVLDESNLTEDGTEMVTFEEIEDENIKDLTQLIGDTDDQSAESLDEVDFDEDAIDDEDVETDEDFPGEISDVVADGEIDDDEDDDIDDLDGVTAAPDDDVELEYAGDLENVEHARGSARPYESGGELEDSDLEELGYKDSEGRTV